MKIIKEGNTTPRWAGEWSCRACRCHWLMEKSDTTPERISDSRDGDYFQMHCPKCNHLETRSVSIPSGNRDEP